MLFQVAYYSDCRTECTEDILGLVTLAMKLNEHRQIGVMNPKGPISITTECPKTEAPTFTEAFMPSHVA